MFCFLRWVPLGSKKSKKSSQKNINRPGLLQSSDYTKKANNDINTTLSLSLSRSSASFHPALSSNKSLFPSFSYHISFYFPHDVILHNSFLRATFCPFLSYSFHTQGSTTYRDSCTMDVRSSVCRGWKKRKKKR